MNFRDMIQPRLIATKIIMPEIVVYDAKLS